MKNLFLLLFILLFYRSIGQKSGDFYLGLDIDWKTVEQSDKDHLDSLLRIYHNETVDTSSLILLENIANEIYDDRVWSHYNQILFDEITPKIKDTSSVSPTEKELYLKLKMTAVNNLGYLYEFRGLVEQSLNYYFESLAIAEVLHDTESVSILYGNIAYTLVRQDEFEKAEELYKKSLKLKQKVGDLDDLANAHLNIGYLFAEKGNHRKAIDSYLTSYDYYKQNNDTVQMSLVHNNIGNAYNNLNSPDTAIIYLRNALKERKNSKNSAGLCDTYLALSNNHYPLNNNVDSALYYGKLAMEQARILNYPENIRVTAKRLYQLYKEKNEYKLALEMKELNILMRDSIKNEETQKAAIRQQTKYEFEKEQLVAEQQRNEELRILNEELSRRNNLQYSLIFLGILLFFGLVLSLGFIKVSTTVAEGLIFFAFLILFEFLLVLGDPFVESFTGGEPIYKLLANALLAGLIFPLHAFFERILKNRLVKN